LKFVFKSVSKLKRDRKAFLKMGWSKYLSLLGSLGKWLLRSMVLRTGYPCPDPTPVSTGMIEITTKRNICSGIGEG